MPPLKRSVTYTTMPATAGPAPKRTRATPYARAFNVRKALLKASEQKAAAFAITTQHADTTGEVRLITAPANGADSNQRVGKKCLVNMVELNLQVKASAVTAGGTPVYQWWLVYDKHPNGALPTIATILVGTQGSRIVLPAAEPRFSVMAHGYGAITKPTNYENQGSIKLIEKKVKCSKNMIFTGDTGAIADISEGAIYLITEGDTANANPHPVVTGEACLYFKDL